MTRMKAVIVKEFAHILRDPTSLVIIFVMPLLMMFIFGYSINYDLETIETGVIDYSEGDLSRRLIRTFSNNGYFEVEDLRERFRGGDPLKEGEALLKSGELKELIVIPRDFTAKLKSGRKTEVGIIIDGSDSNVANLVHQYNEQILFRFISDFQAVDQLFNVRTKILFNPEVKSAYFFIPGLVAVLLVMISAILTSLSITREKESGSIDLIFISPLKSIEIIIGKAVPYIFVALLVGMIILLFARYWFGVPFRGNLSILFVFSLLYIFTGLSMGILVSTIAPNQKAAMFMALLSTLLPSIMLSGFIFPLESMAKPLQVLSHAIPARYYLKIIRGVAVKGAELEHFVTEGIAMVIFAVVLTGISVVKFSKSRKHSK